MGVVQALLEVTRPGHRITAIFCESWCYSSVAVVLGSDFRYFSIQVLGSPSRGRRIRARLGLLDMEGRRRGRVELSEGLRGRLDTSRPNGQTISGHLLLKQNTCLLSLLYRTLYVEVYTQH